MTGYAIFGGYNSTWSRDEVDEELEKFLNGLREKPEQIIREVLDVEPGSYEAGRLADFAEMYRRDEDLTCKLCREEGRVVIRQLASSLGGNESRDYKEACRRAVVRLATKHMHSKGMEVCYTVC
jgi:hypothetical protein